MSKENKVLEDRINVLESQNKNLVETIEGQVCELVDKKIKEILKKQQTESKKAKTEAQMKKQLVTIDTIKTENKPTSKQVVQAQKPKQIVQMPKQETEIPKKAVQIKPVQIKEAADTIMPRIRKGKTQILGFFDTNDDDLY